MSDPLDRLDARVPRCPHCGFVVFTRLNPCCDKCGMPLPAAMVCDAQEREAYVRQLRIDAARLVRAREATFGLPSNSDATQLGENIAGATETLIVIAGELLS
jgi:hypothetical protein